jgi:hypothetical protein
MGSLGNSIQELILFFEFILSNTLSCNISGSTYEFDHFIVIHDGFDDRFKPQKTFVLFTDPVADDQ